MGRLCSQRQLTGLLQFSLRLWLTRHKKARMPVIGQIFHTGVQTAGSTWWMPSLKAWGERARPSSS